ncbi:thiamine-phosphate pyrophosphorylase [candidate division WOR-3 bacterium]|nr:thiamine-phosphate pyrophosphorylase [candidate division WOR-3 bacterium]
MKEEVAQIIDANLNRAREGLRVVEEVARFVLRNEKLTKEIKAQRHKLSALFKKQDLIKFRDTKKDLGKYKDFDFDDSSYRSLRETVQRNLSRAQEGCRVLEEFSKLFSKELPPKIKEIRFNIYELEKTIIQLISKATE